MRIRRSLLAVLTVALLLLSGCTGDAANDSSSQIDPASYAAPSSSSREEDEGAASNSTSSVSEPEPMQQPDISYIEALAQEAIAVFYQPGMSEYEMAKAAFDYMLETTTLVDPVGLDLWRIRGNYSAPPSFVENRSLSVLLYRVGMCEDYAATLTTLLRSMGLEAEYVPGLTYSTQGELVDHAWTIVKVDGVWYHLDCQLEQNISRHGSVRYKYFMRSDGTMSGSHRWGQNLINSELLGAAQNEEIARSHLLPTCPQDYPTPERQALTLPTTPDVAAIRAEIEAEFAEYERVHGKLPPLESNIIPPVFALEGYGPQD